MVVEVFVGVIRHQVRAAQIAEVSLALEADHMIATHSLLSRRVTGWTRRREALEVIKAGQLFLIELFLSTRIADRHHTMPTLSADNAKSEAAVLADGEALRHGDILRL